eukprot:TRINITY_DN11873_c0_g1_i1.p1 TRINITY_DN11873_c0_g1~~TRINITY_DN11873_c0_g1_i1.p1  ORF type:complete len:397 (-),score=121.12 TRINITY_DN11873_c0_g1_i1:141-1331(-)
MCVTRSLQVDLTKVDETKAKDEEADEDMEVEDAAAFANPAMARAEAKEIASAPRSGNNASIRQLPEQLTFWEAVATEDKDREGLLAMWLLRRFRWAHCVVNTGGLSAGPAVPAGGPPSSSSSGGRVIVFCNAISMVQRLTPCLALLLESPAADTVLSKVRMKQDKNRDAIPGPVVEVLGLHSQMRQKDRLKRIERFRKVPHAVLVCTDVAARGLDVKDVTAVVHYQVPRAVEIFVHRSGRTARAGRDGSSIAFSSPKDDFLWQRLYKAAGIEKAEIKNIDPTAFEVAAAKEGARLALDLEAKVHKLDKDHKNKCWFLKAAEEAEITLDDEIINLSTSKEHGADAAPKRQLAGLYQQLIARVRRPPRRFGGGPMSIRQRQAAGRRSGLHQMGHRKSR